MRANTTHLTVRLTSDLHAQLEQLAQSAGRSKSAVTADALASYISQQQWRVADIQAGLQEADRGEYASAQEVGALFAKYGH